MAFLSLPVWHFLFFFSCCFVGRKLANLTFSRCFAREKFFRFPYKVKLRHISWKQRLSEPIGILEMHYPRLKSFIIKQLLNSAYSIIAKYLCIWGSKRAAISSVFSFVHYMLLHSPDSLSSTTTTHSQASGLDNISALLLKDAADLLN